MLIPQDNRWTQLNNGNLLGALNHTSNVHLDSTGEVGLNRRSIALIDSTTSNFSGIMAIVYFSGDYFVVTDNQVFKGDLSLTNFSAVGSSPDFDTTSDAVVCFNRLYITDTSDIAYYTGSAWTTGVGSLTSGVPHPLCVFDSFTDYKLAVGDSNTVKLYNSSGSTSGTNLALPQNYQVTSIAYRNGYLFVGTKEINGGEAAVFMWDGDTANANYKIPVGAGWVYSVTPYRGTVACVTNEGEILLINGTSVQQLATFPVYHQVGARWEQGNATRGKVFNRGFISQGDVLYINASGDVEVGEAPNMRNGVWCFDPSIGLYHYTTPTTDLWVEDSGITAAASVITTSATHNLALGDAVTFSAVSGLSGIDTNVKYYAIPVAADTLKVAGTRQDAFDGNNITITGTVTTDTLNYAPNTDFGSNTTTTVASGAVAVTNYLDSANRLFETDIIYGCEVKNEAGNDRDVLCVLSDSFNVGTLYTQRIHTSNPVQDWNNLYTYLSGILGSNEKAIIRYKTSEKQHYPSRDIAITWTSTTTFTTTDPAALYSVAVGDLVEVRSGYGQGRFADVTATDLAAGTLTVTVDTAIGTAGSAVVRFDNFKKAGTITATREHDGVHRNMIGTKSSWVQIMVEIQGFLPRIKGFNLSEKAERGVI